MSAPLQREQSLDDPRLYAPPWARERPLPVAGQPQSTSSLPAASASPTAATGPAPAAATAEWAPRMPKGGPNIACPPAYEVQPEFAGDIAMRALRRKLALEPDIAPEPPIVLARDLGIPWITRFTLMLTAAGVAGFVAAYVATSGSQPWTEPAAHRTTAVAAAPATVAVSPIESPPRLVVESHKVAANEPLPLGISLQGAAGGEFITLAGLAAGTRLTAGAPIGSKGWRLMARDLGSVLAYPPRDYVGAMEAAIDLRSSGDTLLDSQIVRLEWTPKHQNAAQSVVAAQPPLRQLDPVEVTRLIQRGRQFLQLGDISTARLLLRRAADAGSAEAALALGATFDPVVLREIGVLGFTPNVVQARLWYRRAAELGSGEAARRAERLADR